MKVKIGDLTNIKTGKLDANASSEDGQYPFFTCSREPLKISTYSYDCECVLVAGNGDLNVKYYKGKFDAYQRTYIIEDNGSGKLYMPYLFYFMEGYIEELRKQSIGGVIKYIKLKNLTDALIELPSLDEQMFIVNVLKNTKNILCMRNSEFVMLDNLIKSRFVELFSGTYKEIVAEDVCTQIIDCPHSTPKYDEENLIYPAIRTSEIQDGTISWESMKYVGAVEYEKRIKRLKPEKGDIVYAREGTYGDCVILPERHKFCLGQRTMLFRPDYRICTSAYLHAALRSDAVKRQADESNAGSTVPHVNVADAKRFHFPLPPLELQQQFADFVAQVDKSKVAVQKALDETQLLFDSLMQEYFG